MSLHFNPSACRTIRLYNKIKLNIQKINIGIDKLKKRSKM